VSGVFSLAMLFLAAGTAHAGRYHTFNCNHGIIVSTAQIQHHDANGERDVAKDTYEVQIENLPSPNNFRVKFDKWGFPSINGKPCTLQEKP
jgi:hypothetical protein